MTNFISMMEEIFFTEGMLVDLGLKEYSVDDKDAEVF